MSTSADKGSSNIDKCPVDHHSRAKWMEISQSQTTQKTEQNASDSSEIKKCPVDHHSAETKKLFTTPIKRPETDASSNSHLNPDNLMYSADAVQHPHPDQKAPLSQDREVSSIPRADQGNWIYPSEQMFYNAMKRKDWNPREGDMGVVVPIHNAVNEMAWFKILEWEKLHESECLNPKLVRFMGRPQDITPKARFKQMMGYKLPFDRHDWTVDRCGKEITYVIDFYGGKPHPMAPEMPTFFIDARPSIKSPGSIVDHFKMFYKNNFGGEEPKKKN